VTVDLATLVADFACGIALADRRRPQARKSRTGAIFQPGIGPHSEAETVRLVMAELRTLSPDRYGAYTLGVPYPEAPRQQCDLCLGTGPEWAWAIEVKMLRFLGDNGKLNDNILMHILSPYAEHRSALTDCDKLRSSGPHGRRAILIYGFDYDDWPLDPPIQAFEILARAPSPCPSSRYVTRRGSLATLRTPAPDGLPVHGCWSLHWRHP
jgi:hypothetical protein